MLWKTTSALSFHEATYPASRTMSQCLYSVSFALKRQPCKSAIESETSVPVDFIRIILCLAVADLTTIFLKFPVSVVERTYLASLQPARYAMKVESMLVKSVSLEGPVDEVKQNTYIADSPSDCTFFIGRRSLVCLTLNTCAI